MQIQFNTITDDQVARRVAVLHRLRDETADIVIAGLIAGHNPVADAMDTEDQVAARAVADMIAAADKAEVIYHAKIVAHAVAELEQAGRDTMPPVRMIAQRIPDKPSNGKARRGVRYRVTTEDGALLIDNSDHPFTDGAAALWMLHDLPEHSRVAMRYEEMVYDRHGPMKLKPAAALGIKRLESRTRLHDMRDDAA